MSSDANEFTRTTLPSIVSKILCTSTTKLFRSLETFIPCSLFASFPNEFMMRSNSNEDVKVSRQSTQQYMDLVTSRNAQVTVLFPPPGGPVIQTAGGEGYDQCPMRDSNEDICVSRHGYSSFNSSPTEETSTVIACHKDRRAMLSRFRRVGREKLLTSIREVLSKPI
jgi:hypothetical protein